MRILDVLTLPLALTLSAAAFGQGLPVASVDLAVVNDEQGLSLVNAPINAQNYPVLMEGRYCRTNEPQTIQQNMYFVLAPNAPTAGARGEVTIAVEYFDNGVHPFSLVYDGVLHHQTRHPTTVQRTATSTWKIHVWKVTDGWFQKRVGHHADFWLEGKDLFVDKVHVVHGRRAWMDLGSNNTEAGITNHSLPNSDSHNVPTAAGTARQFAGVGPLAYFYFDVDDRFAVHGARRDLFVSVEYLDQGTRSIHLEYHAHESNYKRTGTFYRTNSGTLRTHTWYLKDAVFGNGQNGGCDFRVVGGGANLTLDKVWVWDGKKCRTDLGANNISSGLNTLNAMDGETVATVQGGLDCRTNKVPGADCYMYFDVDDAFAFKGNRKNVFVTVHYFDNGHGSISLQYHSTSRAYQRAYPSIVRTDTNTWKVHTWRLSDAYFGNGQNGGMDLRLEAGDRYYVDLFYVRDDQTELRSRAMCPPDYTLTSSTGVPLNRGHGLRDLIAQPHSWTATRAWIGVFKDYIQHYDVGFDGRGHHCYRHLGPRVIHTDAEIRAYHEKLQSWGKLHALELSVLKEWTPTPASSFYCQQPILDRLVGLGGSLDAIHMDHPMHARVKTEGQDLTSAAAETAEWIRMFRSRYPDTRVIDLIPYPSFTTTHLKNWVHALNDACAAIGVEAPDGWGLDTAWSRYLKSPRVGSWSDVAQLLGWFRGRRIPTILVHWDARNSASAPTDADWYHGVLESGAGYAGANARPDQHLIQSWLRKPNFTVPETTRYTFTNSVYEFFRRGYDR